MGYRERFPNSVLRLKLAEDEDSENFQTAWLFTKDGDLLTAGHGFRAIAAECGDRFVLEHTASRWKGEAVLNEYGKGDGGQWDYAILRLDTGMPSGLRPLPVSKSVLRTDFALPQLVIGYGHSADLAGRTMIFEGKLQTVGVEPGIHPAPRWQIDTVGNEAPGLSGGPICVDEPHKADGAIALQVQQGASVESRYLFFAQRLSDVHRSSALFRKLLQNQWERDTFRRWPLHMLEAKHFAHVPAELPTGVRWVWSIRPLGKGILGGRICDVIRDEKNAFGERLAAFVARQMWLEPRMRNQPILANIREKNWPQDPNAPPDLSIFFATGSTTVAKEYLADLRVICDFTGNMNFDVGTYPASGRGSHLLAIRFFMEQTRWVSSVVANVDLLLDVADSNLQNERIVDSIPVAACAEDKMSSKVDVAADIFFNVVEDLLLDANIFHALPFVQSLFASWEGARAFSAAKAAFIRERGMLVDGLQAPTSPIGFISLSGCARSSLGQPIRESALEKIWREFVNGFLFPSLLDRVDGIAPSIGDEEAVSAFCAAQRIGGQISPNRLRERLAALATPSGELCALAKVVAEPRVGAQRTALRQLFRPGQRMLRMVGAFSSDHLPALCRSLPYVRIFLFRRKNGSPPADSSSTSPM